MTQKKVIVVGAGNAALCAGIAALEAGAAVTIVEKAPMNESGGNSRYTAGAMRFAYQSKDDLLPLLLNHDEPRLQNSDFGSYSKGKFEEDLRSFQEEKELNIYQSQLIDKSYETMVWLKSHNVAFEPIYERQSFIRNGQHVFWGGLTLAAKGEGTGLVDAQISEFIRIGGNIKYGLEMNSLIRESEKITGIVVKNTHNEEEHIYADAVILACGGFEANKKLRSDWMGKRWEHAKVRGTPHNSGQGLTAATSVGGYLTGSIEGCHAVPMDLYMPDYGNLSLDFKDRKQYRKICYFLGVMINDEGHRFVDEGQNFRNYTYAQFGRKILEQPNYRAWQVFDSKVFHLLYSEYMMQDAHFVEADSLQDLIAQMNDVNQAQTLDTIQSFNDSVHDDVPFDPSILDGRNTPKLPLPKSNWANKIDTPPFRAYPVTCGITFTYGGVKVSPKAEVLNKNGNPISGLFACGEMIGGIFFDGYPGGSGLTSGAVYGKIAGTEAAKQ